MIAFIFGAIVGAALGIIAMGILHDLNLNYPEEEEDNDEKRMVK